MMDYRNVFEGVSNIFWLGIVLRGLDNFEGVMDGIGKGRD
jgi:hypothetical protein